MREGRRIGGPRKVKGKRRMEGWMINRHGQGCLFTPFGSVTSQFGSANSCVQFSVRPSTINGP